MIITSASLVRLSLLLLLLHRQGPQSEVLIGVCSSSPSSSKVVRSRAAALDASSPPSFVSNTLTHAVVAVGRNASLQCRVRNIADRAVSWIRQSDLRILSLGSELYTTDVRFSISSSDDLWTLSIANTREEDGGDYECQINTEPKASKPFRLQVVEPKARIMGDRDVMVDLGSDLTLVCHISSSPEPPESIHWMKDKVVRIEDELVLRRGGGVSVVTDNRRRRSSLVLAKVDNDDQGQYTCVLNSNESLDTIDVHVIKGLDPSTVMSRADEMSSTCLLIVLLAMKLLPF